MTYEATCPICGATIPVIYELDPIAVAPVGYQSFNLSMDAGALLSHMANHSGTPDSGTKAAA